LTWLQSLELRERQNLFHHHSEKILNVLGFVRIDTEVFKRRSQFWKVGIVVILVVMAVVVVPG
jgi:hypothetical protein